MTGFIKRGNIPQNIDCFLAFQNCNSLPYGLRQDVQAGRTGFDSSIPREARFEVPLSEMDRSHRHENPPAGRKGADCAKPTKALGHQVQQRCHAIGRANETFDRANENLPQRFQDVVWELMKEVHR